MADGTTVDSLQIEIEATSEEAEKRVNALAAALERLKKTSTGFGNVAGRIKDIGSTASGTPAAEKVKQRKQALDRATKPGAQTVAPGADFENAASQIEATDKKIEKVKASIAELNEQIRMLGFAHDQEQGAQAIEQLNKQLREQQGILDGLIQKREKLSSMMMDGVVKEPKRAEEPWSEIKARLKGSTLGDLVGDTKSVDEAVNRMVDLNDKVSILNIKLEGLQEKLRKAFESGNQSQVANYTAQIQNLKEKIGGLIDQSKQAEDSDTEQVESETSLQKKLGILQSIKETVEKISGAKINIDIGKDTSGALNNIASSKIKEIVPKGADTAVKALEGAVSGLLKKLLGFASAHPIVTGALLAIGVAVKKVTGEMGKLAQIAQSVVKKGLELLANGAKNLANSLKKLASSGISKAVSGLKSVGKSVVSSFTRPFTDALKAYNQWKSAIGRIAFYRAVREAIKAVTDGFKTGIENLYQYSRLIGTEFAPAMNSLATSALYLKNSLGAMAAPLIQAVAPAIDFLIDKFVALINVIGKAFAMLTGKSVYTQAKKHAVEYADAAGAASKATQKFLLGIDELTILDNPSGGGGSALEDYASMFEEVEIDQDKFDWVKQIREAIENGEWRSVGELVATKLNEVVDSWDSYAWGAKLGSLLNNGLNVAYGFLTTFGFDKIGAKVADGLNGIFDEVGWDLLGRTFAAKWNALFDFIYGFATTLKWHEIGLDIAKAINGFLDELDPSKAAKAVSAFVTGLFDMISTAIAETNWNVLGDKLGQFLNEVDWYGAIYGALSIITNGLAALKSGIDGFLARWNFKDTAKQIYSSINQAFYDVNWMSLGDTLGNLIVTALEFAVDVISNVDWPKIGRSIGEFLIGIDWVDVFGGLTEVIAAGIGAAVKALGGFVDTIAVNIKEIATGIASKVNEFFEKIDWKETGRVLSDGIEAALDFMITFMQQVEWDSIGKHIAEFLEKIDWNTLLTKWGQLMGEFLSAKMKLIDVSGILEVGANIVKGLWNGIWAEFDASGGILGWIQRNIFDVFMNAIKGLFGIHSPSTVMAEIGRFLVEGLLGGLSDTWNFIIEFFGNGIDTVKSKFSQGWEDIKTNTTSLWETIKTSLGAIWDNISGASDTTFEKIKSTVSGKWESVKSDTTEKWNQVKSTLSETWGNIATTTETRLSGIRNSIANKWDSVNTDTRKKWENTKSAVSDSLESMKNTAETKISDIKNSMSQKWGDIAASASKWGSDLCSNLANGIRSGINWVTNAVSSVANSVKSFLHFSEPDIGPLSDFHTYMPDMLSLMAKGIKDNSYLAVNAASDLADTMSRTLGDIEPAEPKFSAHETIFASVQPSYSGANGSPINTAAQENQAANSMEVINTIFAAAQLIVNAINENGDRPINIDWGSVASGMTSMQNRQNMMYGKTLQNA